MTLINNILKVISYCFDKIIDLIKYIIDASKLTFYKVKLLLFTCFMGLFAFNYFFEYTSTNNIKRLTFNPKDIPVSSILIIAILIAFLVLIDLFYIIQESIRLHQIIENKSIAKSIREKAAEKLLKNK